MKDRYGKHSQGRMLSVRSEATPEGGGTGSAAFSSPCSAARAATAAVTFKDALAHDAAAVFCNPAEFAETMDIDGTPMPALWGETVREANAAGSADAWGLNTETAVLLLPANTLTLPVPGQNLTVNGQTWSVINAHPQTGILRLELERNVA